MIRKLLIAVIVLGFLYGAFVLYELLPADSGSDRRVPVTVESGMSVARIAALLEEKSLIRSASAFTVYVRYKGIGGALKAGVYLLSPSQSAGEIAGELQEGKSEEIVITIPEGYTVADIDALLASRVLGKAGDFIECARSCDFSDVDFLPQRTMKPNGAVGTIVEGYLFPDTYYVAPAGYKPKEFIDRLLQNFRSKIIDAHRDAIASGKRPLKDLVIMASLVEEESRGDEDERSTVAAILWNRLDADTGLGADATIRYALGKPKSGLTKDDLQADSPYNTRKYRGLPPTPIANPGLTSIEAALKPKATEYWYYLHDPQGKIHYAKTNDEHNENRARYLD